MPTASDLNPTTDTRVAVGESSEMYFRAIAHHQLLRADEEVALAQQMEDGKRAAAELWAESANQTAERPAELERRADLECRVELGNQARLRMIECNLRLVVSLARHYVRPGLWIMDLVQEGNIGLQVGLEKYDWRRGFRVSTYVHWWIRQAILKAVKDHGGALRLPADISSLLVAANRVERRLLVDLGRQPTLEEIADELGDDPARLAVARQTGRPVLLLGMPASSSDGEVRSLGDVLVDEKAEVALPAAAEGNDLSERLGTLVDKLDPLESRVLRLRFGLGDEIERSHAEAAQEMNLSVGQVRQLETKALGHLRQMPRIRRELAEYVDADLRAAA